MDLSIIYQGEPVGTACLEPDGVYWKFSGHMAQAENGPMRLYALHLWQSEYLGIPDANGQLHTRLPKKHLPNGADVILASHQPNGTWKPWAGEIDGIRVETALLRQEGGIQLALNPDEAVRFPEWIDTMEKVQVSGSERLLLRLDKERNLPEIEKILGGTNNETMDYDAPAGELPVDDFSVDDDFGISDFDGAEQGWQADCSDF